MLYNNLQKNKSLSKIIFYIFLFYFFCISIHAHTVNNMETILPLQFDTGNTAPYGIPSTIITIQGKEFPIIFDTGAKNTQLALTPYALKNINVKFTGRKICFNAMDGKFCEKEFIIPHIKLGSFTINNVKGVEMSKLWGGNDAGFKETEASRNGVLGFALLSQFNYLLDYRQAKAILIKHKHSPSTYDIDKWVAIPFNEHCITKLKLDGKPVTFSWDTGAIPSIIGESAAKHFNTTPCSGNAPYVKQHCMSIKTHSFSNIKGDVLSNTWFKVVAIPPIAPFSALIGSNFFAENVVYFDFNKHIIYVKPNDKF